MIIKLQLATLLFLALQFIIIATSTIIIYLLITIATLLFCILSDLDQWLKRTIEDVSFDAGPSMRKFLQSTEADCKKMDVDLSAGNNKLTCFLHSFTHSCICLPIIVKKVIAIIVICVFVLWCDVNDGMIEGGLDGAWPADYN